MRTAKSQAELDLGKVQIVTEFVAGSINGWGQCEWRRVETKGDLGMSAP